MGKPIHSPGGEYCWKVWDTEPITLPKSPESVSVKKLKVLISDLRAPLKTAKASWAPSLNIINYYYYYWQTNTLFLLYIILCNDQSTFMMYEFFNVFFLIYSCNNYIIWYSAFAIRKKQSQLSSLKDQCHTVHGFRAGANVKRENF